MLVIRAETHKILVRLANRENPDQTASSEAVLKKQSDLGLPCLSIGIFCQATSVQNFRTLMVSLLSGYHITPQRTKSAVAQLVEH